VSTTRVQGSDDVVEVVLGVDTHLDAHVVVALNQLGRPLGKLAVPTAKRGYHTLLSWAEGFGPVRCAGIEGTGSYGAGLARHLKAAGIAVVGVQRPKRRHLRRNGKSDPIDAETAARAVLAGEAAGEPKNADGRVEMIRVLRAARRSAVKAKTQAANQLQGLRVTAPEVLRHRLRALSRQKNSSPWPLAPAPLTSSTTWRRLPGSRFVRWPDVTGLSRRRSSSWRHNSSCWWQRPLRNCSPYRPSAPTTQRRFCSQPATTRRG
jgi:transposase